MLNALKNPFPDDDNPDSVEDVGEKKLFKYKRPLPILFLLVLVVGVCSLFANHLFADQKKNIGAKKNLPKPRIAAPSEDKSATSSGRPTMDKPGPVQVPKPLVKENISKLAYKSDKEYLALTRQGRFTKAAKKPARANRQNVRDTVTTGDKSLALAGRGFDFKGPQSRAGRYVDFAHRLQKPLPKMEPVPEDHLDLQLTRTKSSKDLIFHSSRPALGKYNRQRIYIKDEKPEESKPQVLPNIPATKLLLMEADTSSLILRRSKEPLDLLSGNEKINRKKFGRW